MTAPIPDTEELFLPPLTEPLDEAMPVRRLDWLIVLTVLLLALAGTVALLATLWLQPGSGSVGS